MPTIYYTYKFIYICYKIGILLETNNLNFAKNFSAKKTILTLEHRKQVGKTEIREQGAEKIIVGFYCVFLGSVPFGQMTWREEPLSLG